MTRQTTGPTRGGFIALLVLQGIVCACARPGIKDSQWQTYTTSEGSAQGSSTGGLGSTTRLSLAQDKQLQYGPSFKQLRVELQHQTPQRLYVQIQPEGQSRWRVPDSIVSRPPALQGLSAQDLLYEVKQPLAAAAAGQPFALTVTRKATGQPVFDTHGHSFVFKEQFIELTTTVPADSDLYGLGETVLPRGLLLPRDGSIFTMWARDSASRESQINTYGAHPFYLQLNKDGTANGVFLLNSNGMDVVLNKTSVTFKAIGGMVELYLFMGPTPEEVIRQYHEVIGHPVMPPYWALGAHQAKFGYSNLSVLEDVVANYSAAGLPLEGLWVDIELMNNRFQVFTFDKDRFPAARMRRFADKLHAAGQHWSPLFNPGISVQRGYKAFEEGSAADIWIKDVNGRPYRGQVWPGEVFYPSYLGDKASGWLKSQLKHMHDQVPFDGMWLDMTEAANFCSGAVCEMPTDPIAMAALKMPTPLDFNVTVLAKQRTRCKMECTPAPSSNKLGNPPYAIHNFGWRDTQAENNDNVRTKEDDGDLTSPLDLKSISVTASHSDGTLEYDAHNLYGTSMARHFHNTYRDITGRRGFMLTRSTFPGAGRYTGHWTGDTAVRWDAFKEQTANVLSANMWGLGMTGADICGYGIDGWPDMSDEQLQELCVRWISAGAWYPLSRNHQNFWTKSHEPYRWASTTAAAKKAYGLRYRLLTYIYGSMFLAHKHGGTLARPVFFTSPADLKARNATSQWMMGEALMVSPVYTNTTSTITPHFTAGAWYSAWDFTRIDSKGEAVRMSVPLGDIAVHLRGGTIVPMQPAALVTRDVRFAPVTLVVALPAEPAAAAAAASNSTTNNKPAAALPPFALERQCVSARASNPGKLVSCGLLYADNDSPEVSDANSLQVWFAAVTETDSSSGAITSFVAAAAEELKNKKLLVEAVTIIGLRPKATGAAAASASHVPKWQQVVSPTPSRAVANGTVVANAAGNSMPAVVTISSAAGSRQDQPLKAEFDSAKGVLRVSGLSLLAHEPFSLTWRLL